jgi:hypothetical protein
MFEFFFEAIGGLVFEITGDAFVEFSLRGFCKSLCAPLPLVGGGGPGRRTSVLGLDR